MELPAPLGYVACSLMTLTPPGPSPITGDKGRARCRDSRVSVPSSAQCLGACGY